jgi:anti-sigma regulatory factor (Ser/Thr protein kinase)
MPRKLNPEISEFILRNVESHAADIGSLIVTKFGISRSTASNYLMRLTKDGLVEAAGQTNARHYKLKDIVNVVFSIDLSPGLSDDGVWRFRILPQIRGIKQNVIDICHYGFTEMLNNAIDHSRSPDAFICYEQNYTTITMSIIDHGIGIFEKIQADFGLADPRSALLELSKGKLTSDAMNHSGEGIFFTSRMFDEFSIRSGLLFYARIRQEDQEWLIETEDRPKYEIGTAITLKISTDAVWTMNEVYERYQNDGIGFRKTHVPLKLAKYPGEQLVSRSQAKRVLVRFEKFSEVFLDFQGVSEIGQAFADEIFRVFQHSHPEINIIAINASSAIKRMISQVKAASENTNQVTPPAS